ncbi:MAG: ATP-binding protein [Burkholderiales bacterium]
MDHVDRVLQRAEALLVRLDQTLAVREVPPDWRGIAFRWQVRNGRGSLQAVAHPHRIRLSDLLAIDAQKSLVERNTRQFVDGYPANNVMLTGSRGTGKSSLIKALLHRYAKRGLRLIEVGKRELVDLPDIADQLHGRAERFILFCDDLSFEANEPGYKTLKAALDGSITCSPENVLIFATSNRRHFMPEFLAENLDASHQGGEVHPGEAVEEKISLSERFGLWVSFYPFSQEQYLRIVSHWLKRFKVPQHDINASRAAALQWTLARGTRSGRAAWQFARDWAGRCLSSR